MRVILVLFISSFLLSQPVKSDTLIPVETETPKEIQPTVDKIVENSKEIKKIEEATNKEMQKQIDLMREIKYQIYKLKKSTRIRSKPLDEASLKDSTETVGKNEKELSIEVNGQVVQWETRKRTWLGRFLNTEEILYYPFIIDKEGNKIYLKK